jgi:hypothetical protein
MPSVGAMTALESPTGVETPEHKCYRAYDWMHRANRAFEDRFREDRENVCAVLAAAETPSQIIRGLGMELPGEADPVIDAALPEHVLREVAWDVRHRVAEAVLVRFDWQDAEEWEVFWPPLDPASEVEVCVLRGPSMF